MGRLTTALLATLLVYSTFYASDIRAEGWFYFDPIELEAEICFDGYRSNSRQQSISGVKGTSITRQTLLLEERLYMRLSGYAVDPKISNFSIEIEPVFRQGRESIDNESDGVSGNDMDYNINLGALEGAAAPVDLHLNSFSTTSANDLAFGSQNKTKLSANQLVLNWKNRWFPIALDFKVGSLIQKFTRQDGISSQRDEDRQVFKLRGRSKKLLVSLENERVDENVFGKDYTFKRVLIQHNVLWGHNSRLLSNIRSFDRQGSNAYKSFSWDERLSIHHTDDLTSRTSYRYYSQQAGSKTTLHEGVFQLDHSLYKNLESQFRLRGALENSDLRDRDEIETGIRTHYLKSFDFGTVSAGLNAAYWLTNRVSEAGFAEAINEKHIATFIEPIILEEQLINESTIIVAAEDEFIYTEGFDYEVTRLGGVFSELRVIPNGRIIDGDLLLVSYQYEILPSAKYDSLSTGFDFSYSYRWIRLYLNSYKFEHRLKSGFGQPLDQKHRAGGVELSWNFVNVNARLRAESRRRRHGSFKGRSITLNQSLGVSISNQLSFNISGNQVFFESSGVVTPDPLMELKSQQNENKSNYYALNATLNWYPRPYLTVVPSLGVWKREETTNALTSPEINRLYYNADLRVSWLVRKLTMDFYYSHNVSDIDGEDQIGDRVFFSIRRVFR